MGNADRHPGSVRRAEQVVRGALSDFQPFEEWPRVPWTKLLTPLLMSRRGVQRSRGVEYARIGKKRLLLDVYQPATPGDKRPAVLQIHGGAWVLGSRRDQGLPLSYHLASHGWVGFNADYRLSPAPHFRITWSTSNAPWRGSANMRTSTASTRTSWW